MNSKLICLRIKNIITSLFFNITIILTLIFVGLITVLILIVSGNETPKNNAYDKPYYVAAVVEYYPNLNSNPLESIQSNLLVYEDIIHHASQYNVDILVFPEDGLTGLGLSKDRKEIRRFLTEIPTPESNTIPCFNLYYSKVLKNLSCAARLNHMYVVVNLPEIEQCKTENDELCPDDLAYYYNTNVVFNREGKIIARYRKFNLYREFAFNHTQPSELCTFDTDFGVRFGMFICFDILFQNPAIRLLRETGVKDVIFSTAWFSEIPLLTADAVQAGWAYTNDVNLIAAGYNAPTIGGGGSGIYAGREGPLVMFMPERPGTQIILSRVPKKQFNDCDNQSKKCTYLTFMPDYLVLPYDREKSMPNSTRSSDFKFFADKSFMYFHVTTMRSTDMYSGQDDTLSASFEYKRDGFKCTMTVSWRNENNNETTDYNMFAYSGTRGFGGFLDAHVETCGVTAYKPNDKSDSTIVYYNPPKNLATITSIVITARSSDIGTIPIPTTLDTRNYPLTSDYYAFSNVTVMAGNRRMLEINMKLSKPVANLVTFGIYKLPRRLTDEDRIIPTGY